MDIKIEKGTTRASEPLCFSCQHYRHTRSAETNREWHACDAGEGPARELREAMGECNMYFARRQYVHMEELMPQAYILTRNRQGEVDFIPSCDILNSEAAKDRKTKRDLEAIRYKSAPGFNRRDY